MAGIIPNMSCAWWDYDGYLMTALFRVVENISS